MMGTKFRLVVLMGGKSAEHEVSMISGTEVVKNLDTKKYDILPVVISKDGLHWKLTTKESLLSMANPMILRGTKKEIILSQEKQLEGVSALTGKIDLVFIAMHGPYGEDGVVQGILTAAGVNFTGSGVLASAIGMDKAMFRQVMKANKLPVPNSVVITKASPQSLISKSLGKPPYFVKPVDQGSSVGSSLVKTKKDLAPALKLAFKYSDNVLVDEYVSGLEITCGVIGNTEPVALPITEIHPLKNNFFDYDSKYTESGATEITPARINSKITKQVQALAIEVYKTIGCRDFARVDFILRDNKTPIILEINTIPGLTPASLLPKSAKVAGLEYSDLLDRIINNANEHKK